jgi:hypothetical protein
MIIFDSRQVGKNYVCNEWKQELITFSQFLERMQSDGCPSNLTYLAQHPLFEQVSNLPLLVSRVDWLCSVVDFTSLDWTWADKRAQ